MINYYHVHRWCIAYLNVLSTRSAAMELDMVKPSLAVFSPALAVSIYGLVYTKVQHGMLAFHDN